MNSGSCVCAALAKDDFQFATPMLAEGNQFPLNLGREITKHGLVGGVNAQSRRSQQQSRRERRNLGACEVTLTLKSRKPAVTALGRLPVCVEYADANPIIEGLQGQMKVFIGFEFDDSETAIAVERQQIEHAAISG